MALALMIKSSKSLLEFPFCLEATAQLQGHQAYVLDVKEPANLASADARAPRSMKSNWFQ